MKILRPDTPKELSAVTDLASLLRSDETLFGLNIDSADVSGIKLKSAAISESRLAKCNFSQAKIEKLHIRDCVFSNCDLTACLFADSSWHVAEIVGARCSGVQLHSSLMKNILFKNSKLDFANFRFTQLESVIFENCVINELDLYNATLKNVAFIDCDIENVQFSEAKLKGVDLSGSRIVSIKGLAGLKGASISSEQLILLAPCLARNIGIIIND